MKIHFDYTVEVTDELRLAIRETQGYSGLATDAEVRAYYGDKDVTYLECEDDGSTAL